MRRRVRSAPARRRWWPCCCLPALGSPRSSGPTSRISASSGAAVSCGSPGRTAAAGAWPSPVRPRRGSMPTSLSDPAAQAATDRPARGRPARGSPASPACRGASCSPPRPEDGCSPRMCGGSCAASPPGGPPGPPGLPPRPAGDASLVRDVVPRRRRLAPRPPEGHGPRRHAYHPSVRPRSAGTRTLTRGRGRRVPGRRLAARRRKRAAQPLAQLADEPAGEPAEARHSPTSAGVALVIRMSSA